jgi:hypothetical protein
VACKQISASTMVAVTKSEVPKYLHNSALYQSIGDDEDDAFEVPDGHMKSDDGLNCDLDVHYLLTTMRYWGVDDIPQSLIDYLLLRDVKDVESLLGEFGNEMPYVEAFVKLKQAKCVEKEFLIAVSVGAVSVIHYLCEREKRLRGDDLIMTLKLRRYDTYCTMAAQHGRFECLKFLLQKGFPWSTHTCAAAAESGNLSILRYLYEQGCGWEVDTCIAAATKGSLPCLQYAHEQGCLWNYLTCYYAAQNNHLHCLKYAVEQGCELRASVATIAAMKGNMQCLQYLHEQGCPWETMITCQLARAGRLESLRYVHEHGAPWHKHACDFAAAAGQLECLQYAREHGAEWGEATTTAAAGEGHLPCLRYLHRQGCAWSSRATRAAAVGGHFECLDYATSHGCEVSADDAQLLVEHEKGPWGNTTVGRGAAGGEKKASDPTVWETLLKKLCLV